MATSSALRSAGTGVSGYYFRIRKGQVGWKERLEGRRRRRRRRSRANGTVSPLFEKLKKAAKAGGRCVFQWTLYVLRKTRTRLFDT